MSSANWGPCEEAPRPRTSLIFLASVPGPAVSSAILQGEQSEADEETGTCHLEPGPCHTRASACPAGLCGLHSSAVPLGTMADSTTTLTFIVLLCLGLCQGPWDQVQAEFIPSPFIWADPGRFITNGSSVTIWCKEYLQASAHSLYKDGGSDPLEIRIPQDSSNKACFLIEAMTPSHTGLYQCAYYTTEDKLSQRSDPLLLVVTGMYPAPSLSAQPSPVVASGGNVSLSCSSQFTSGPFHLLMEGKFDPPRHMEAELRIHNGRSQAQAIFSLDPVFTSHGGTYRCYGSSSSNPNVWSQPSAPLHIEVTDSKPQDPVPILAGMGVAGLVLVVFAVILCQTRNDNRRTLEAARM
ncbi:leukocyte immunoglobulin-like receptor subfamily A member 5 isoform X1 [Myotis daubentonii]|uniref:leukocyte immunoglobulin-like receptor subfamily A member 5 isoform X1 n=1 Tax=Myotis daubentonii TaxID=98922 RepID=UPI002872CA81|nr:leukocyte immunoglobulin-like receptor subfamily A member 5 isoform X1 [Myotis daubentonii]